MLLLFAVVDVILDLESMPKSDDLGHRILKIEKSPVGFCIFGLHKQGHSFLRSENTNLSSKSNRTGNSLRQTPTRIKFAWLASISLEHAAPSWTNSPN